MTNTGWYLYGITRGSSATVAGAPQVQLLESAGLVAVVRPVRLADFTPAALEQQLRSESDLEAMVRSHHRIIETIHAEQAILPAKFGVVYTSVRDIVSALQSAHDSLLRQLDRLEGCDEWAVHVYADRATARERMAAADAQVQRLRRECAESRPGRAYFLERQLRDELEALTQQELSSLALQTFDRLASSAVVGQMNDAAAGGNTRTGEVEILRASFLVWRDVAAHFVEEVRCVAEQTECLRCECSGPWPPYSFAVGDEEQAA